MIHALTTLLRLLLLLIAVPAGIACGLAADAGNTGNAVLLGVVCVLCLLAQTGYARMSKP